MKEPWRARIGRELAEARKRQNLTVREVAKRAGLPHTVIVRLEGGQRNFTIDTLERAAVALSLEFGLKRAGGLPKG